MKKQVLVVDASKAREFSHFFPENEKFIPVISQCNVDLTTQEFLGSIHTDHYDYLLFYFGDRTDKEKAQEMDELFAISFCDRTTLEELRSLMKTLKVPMDLILRNVCETRADKNRYSDYLKKENMFITESMVIPFDEIDESYRIRMQYEPLGDFRGISSSLEKALIRVVNFICPVDRMVIKDAVRKARKGVWL